MLAVSEFTEHEAPLPGVPSEEEIKEHYGEEVWRYYTASNCRSSHKDRAGGHTAPASASDPQEFIRQDSPHASLPNLCGDYNLPALRADGLSHQPEGDDPAQASRR